MDIQWMYKALALAQKGQGKVSPNPLVGCIIVYNNILIGQGWHKAYKKNHAEKNALMSVKDKGLLSKSIMYINLEPCTHFGHTPPCIALLLQYKIKKIFIAHADPNPKVYGKGIAMLKKNGITTHIGLLAEEAKKLNLPYFTFYTQKRPFITLKWAQTLDGFMAKKNLQKKWISNKIARSMVHQWRSQHEGILVGTNTVLYDNPQLNVRTIGYTNKQPIRIFIDKFLRCNGNLFITDKKQPTLCYNLLKNRSLPNITYVQLNNHENFLTQMLHDLYKKNIQSVLVEGGAFLLNTLIKANYWDVAKIFISQKKWYDGIPSPKMVLKPHQKSKVLDNDLYIWYNHYATALL